MRTAPEVLTASDPGHGYWPLGMAALRQGVAERLSASGTPTTAAEILITNGAQGALQLIISAFVRGGDRVIVESPTYTGAIELLSRAGAAVEGIVRDHAGPRADLFERALQGPEPALALLVPTCHNPTGTTMSEQRRREILAACAGRDLLLIEDQTMAELTFSGSAPPAMAQLAPDRVIAIGSFSKLIWGGLRTGWIRADAATILRLGRLKAAQDMGAGQLDQAACLSALPRLDEIAAARQAMASERHDVLREAIEAELPEWQIGNCYGGYSLWIKLPHVTAGQLVRAALQHGVAIASGGAGAGASDDRHLDHVRICFAQEPAVLREAVSRLRNAWDRVLAEAASPSPIAAV
jgi:DNA-binding transcriptional MocR family regulator